MESRVLREKNRLPLLATLLGAVVMAVAFLWPLSAYVFSDIPCTTRAAETSRRVELQQGDHLQLLYHFQLVGKMTRGEIPLFSNPYEFNLGEDRRIVDPYYVPFSLVYAAAEPLVGPAGAWNLAQLSSVLVGAWFLFLLARRWCPDRPGLAAVAALAALCVPYRWETLAGGSPTGFGMAWLPGIALGVDILVRDGRARGGLLAGILLLFCYTTDLHCFLFGILSLPFWYIVSWLARDEGNLLPTRRDLGRVTVATLPLLVFVALSGGIAMALRRMYASTDAAGGRTIADLCSPFPAAILDPQSTTFMAAQVFLGWGLIALVLVAAGCALRQGISNRKFQIPESAASTSDASSRKAFAILLILLAIVGSVLLALAARGPMDGIAVRTVRKLVPPFKMVRQPIKVFCLLPALLAPVFAWLLKSRVRTPQPPAPNPQPLIPILVFLLAFIPAFRSMHAGLCSLPGVPNGAYRAAATENKTARALVLPVWPGDSSWSSVYQHHAIRSGLRMLNGYAAVKTDDYLENVFRRFETATLGDLTFEQQEALNRYGVTTLIVHEDAFPEKVSPCPVGTTLRRFLAHPQLTLLAHDGPVWAFTYHPLTDVSAFFPPEGPFACARAWHFPDGGCVPSSLDKKFRFTLHHPADWMRQAGFQWHVYYANGTVKTFPLGPENPKGNSCLDLEGDVAVRDVLYTSDPVVTPGFYAAADLFHAGWSESDASGGLTGTVVLPPETPASEAVYGPNRMLLPAPGTTYELVFRGTNLDKTQVTVTLGDERLGPFPETEPVRFAAPSQPELLRVGLHLQGGAERGEVRVDGFELTSSGARRQ